MKKTFKDEQARPTWQAFEQQQQEFTTEANTRGASTLDPSLLGTSAYDPSKYIVKLPEVKQFQQLPSVWDAMKGSVEGFANNIDKIAEQRLDPVNAAARAVSLEDSQDSLTRLQNLQKPVMGQDGKPLLDSTGTPVTRGDFLGSTGPNGTSYGPAPISGPNAAAAFNTSYIPKNPKLTGGGQTSGGQTGGGQTGGDQSGQNQNSGPPAPPVVDPNVYNDVTNPIQQATPDVPAATTSTGANSGSATNSSLALNSGSGTAAANGSLALNSGYTPPTSPTPVDAAPATRPANLEESLAWYQQLHDTGAKSARAELDPISGGPTGRIVMSNPKSGVEQVVDPGHIPPVPVDQSGGSSVANSVLSAPPVPPQQNVVAQNSQTISPLLQKAMQPQQPIPLQADPATSLAAGTITPQQIASLAGPSWTASAGGPQAPLPAPPGHRLLGAPGTLPPIPMTSPTSQPTTNQPSTTTTGGQPVVDEEPKPQNFGLSSAEVLRQAQQAVIDKKAAMDDRHPMWTNGNGGYTPGSPSMSMPITGSDGKQENIFWDPSSGTDANGQPMINEHSMYQRQSAGYNEIRKYLDGTTVTVPNVLSEEQDKAIQQMIIDQGLATKEQIGTLSPDTKESLYRIAANQKLNPQTSNPAVNDALEKRLNILNAGTDLQQKLAALNTQDDPGGIKAKNLLASMVNAGVNKFGPIVGAQPNPALSDAQASYKNFLNIVRAQETNRPATEEGKVGVGVSDSGLQGILNPRTYDTGAIGDLSDNRFGPNLNAYLKSQAQMFSNGVDSALAMKMRIPDSITHASNLAHFSDGAIGTAQNPFVNTNKDSYQKIPMGSSYQWAGTDPSTGKPWPVYTKGKKTAQ